MSTRPGILLSLTAAAVCCSLLPIAAQKIDPPAPPEGQGVKMQGKVVDATTGAPLIGATVELGRSPLRNDFKDMRRWTYTATSGERGEFTISNMLADQYSVNASLKGYGLARGPERATTLPPGETSASLTIRMWRAAAIEGVAEDADRKPLPNIGVEMLQESWSGGVRSLSNAVLPVWTKEDGKFSFPDVLPGTYYLRASPAEQKAFVDALKGGPNPSFPFADTFYPGSIEAEGATPLTVAGGVDQGGLHLQMQRSSYYKVSGRVRGLQEGASNVRVLLQRMSGAAAAGRLGSGMPWVRVQAAVQADGTFSILNVGPGPYVATIEGGGSRGGTPVAVRDTDVNDVTISVLPSWTFAGKMIYEDGYSAGPQIASLGGLDPLNALDAPATQVSPAGDFSYSGVLSGPHRFVFIGNRDLVVKKVQVGQQSFEGGRFEITGSGTDKTVVTLAKRGAAIGGTVELADGNEKRVGGVASMIQMPLDILNGITFRTAMLDTSGGFAFQNLEAGEYQVCAWIGETGIREILNNPSYLPRLSGSCKNVKLKNDGNEQVRLKQLDAGSFH